MAAMLGNSVVVVVVRTRPRAIPLAMITMRKLTHGFPFLLRDAYGAPLGGPLGHRSSAINQWTDRGFSTPIRLKENSKSFWFIGYLATGLKIISIESPDSF